MSTEHVNEFANVYWIGGPPDCGKSTVAGILAERHDLEVYHYDQTDVPHHARLAAANPRYLAFVNANLDERWVEAEPHELFVRSLGSFRDRWPMILEDLRAFEGRPLIAEGFGLTPELVVPVAPPERCVFLVPSPKFKAMSVARRDKPTWRHETRDPERARANLLARDELLGDYIRMEAERRGLALIEVDTRSGPEAVADRIGRTLGM